MINRIRQIKTKNLLWMHIVSPAEPEIQYLRDHYQFHPLDLQDCVNIAQRPKVDEYPGYIFLILLYPHYDRRMREIQPAEIDFFIGPGYIITVSDGKHELVDKLFDDCLKSEVLRERYMADSAAHLLYALLHRFQEGILPMLDHTSQDIANIEQQIFTGKEKRMVRDILLIKRNIVNFRRIVNAHKSTLKRLISIHDLNFFTLSSSLSLYFNNIVDRTKDIWEILEIQKETINAFQEANDSLISFKLNDVMRVLTAISACILPVTLFASIFGMNAINMPIVGHSYGFWILLAMMASLIIGLVFYFKKRDWL